MLGAATSFALLGVDATEITVEADIQTGLPAFTIVGLPDAAVQESRERVRAALTNCGLEFPLRRITINLAPADLRKAGPGFDLALAAAVLAASGQIKDDLLSGYAVCGELGLDGSIRPVRGALVVADAARRAGYRGLVLPRGNVAEASLISDLEIVGVEQIGELDQFLAGNWRPEQETVDSTDVLNKEPDEDHDFAEVRGHFGVKRALEVAAAGGHNVLMLGPPGSGKSMLARRIPTILPPLTLDEALEVTRVHSVAGLLRGAALVPERPFRSPHHTISSAGLIGGGSPPTPGEVSLAHQGVLFLDELPEFQQAALDGLRQPIEDGWIALTRAQRSVKFPARFMFVGAANPCPCGFAGDSSRNCECHPNAVNRHNARLNGPLIDRIDLVLKVNSPPRKELTEKDPTQTSAEIRTRVVDARLRQTKRLLRTGARCNAEMGAAQITRFCNLDAEGLTTIQDAHERIRLTARGHYRVLRVARTIADLDGRDSIQRRDLAEAITYRAQ